MFEKLSSSFSRLTSSLFQPSALDTKSLTSPTATEATPTTPVTKPVQDGFDRPGSGFPINSSPLLREDGVVQGPKIKRPTGGLAEGPSVQTEDPTEVVQNNKIKRPTGRSEDIRLEGRFEPFDVVQNNKVKRPTGGTPRAFPDEGDFDPDRYIG